MNYYGNSLLVGLPAFASLTLLFFASSTLQPRWHSNRSHLSLLTENPWKISHWFSYHRGTLLWGTATAVISHCFVQHLSVSPGADLRRQRPPQWSALGSQEKKEAPSNALDDETRATSLRLKSEHPMQTTHLFKGKGLVWEWLNRDIQMWSAHWILPLILREKDDGSERSCLI